MAGLGWVADVGARHSFTGLRYGKLMGRNTYTDELQLALARSDAQQMCELIDAYAAHYESDWSAEHADDFGEIITCHWDDPDKALAYVVLAAARTDDAAFIGMMACGPLEDILRNPSSEMLDRIVAEARRSARFRWLLSHPFKVAVSSNSWDAIKGFRTTGPHDEPASDTMPPRC